MYSSNKYEDAHFEEANTLYIYSHIFDTRATVMCIMDVVAVVEFGLSMLVSSSNATENHLENTAVLKTLGVWLRGSEGGGVKGSGRAVCAFISYDRWYSSNF